MEAAPFRVAVLTASNRASAGLYEDRSGPALVALVRDVLGADVVETALVPDHRGAIAAKLRRWADELQVDLILTTGGTGFTATDVTPEAALDVIERQAPGLAEAMRAASIADHAIRDALPRRHRHTGSDIDRHAAWQPQRSCREPACRAARAASRHRIAPR